MFRIVQRLIDRLKLELNYRRRLKKMAKDHEPYLYK